MKYYRMQQILLDPHPYAPAVLDRIFADLSGVGCNCGCAVKSAGN